MSFEPTEKLTAYEQGQLDGYNLGWAAGNEHEDALDREIVALKAERDRLRIKAAEMDVDEVETHFQQLEAERDAAYMRGLERAKEIVESYTTWGAIFAIQAEIDKAKAGKP